MSSWTTVSAVLAGCVVASQVAAEPDYDDYGAPESERAQPDKAVEIASISTDRGIVTRPGRLTFEPSISHAYSNSTSVAIEGYTVIPALVVGLINITEIQRDIFVGALTFKYGFSSRLEVGLRVPYLVINEDLRERQAFQGTPVDTLRESSGEGLGDVEMSARFQLTDGTGGWPYLLGTFRVKAPTGESPYDVERRQLFDNDGNPIGIVLSERPTGNGFWSFEPGISFIYPSDPAVLFGNFSYVRTMPDDKGVENGGTIKPGDVVRFGFGMGFAFNERTSYSLSYDHSVIPKTSVEFDTSLTDAAFDRIQVGSLTFGLSQRLTPSASLGLTVSIGVTEQAPNSEIALKLPLSF